MNTIAQNEQTFVELRDMLDRRDAELRQLRADLAQWPTWGVIEVAIRNKSVAEYMKTWEARATKAEEVLANTTAAWCKACSERDELHAKVVTLEAERDALRAELEGSRAIALEVQLAQARTNLALREALGRRLDELTAVVSELQKLQPGGSPPPGGPEALARWIVTAIQVERDETRSDKARLQALADAVRARRDQIRAAYIEQAELRAKLDKSHAAAADFIALVRGSVETLPPEYAERKLLAAYDATLDIPQ